GVQVLLVIGIVLYAFHLVDNVVARWDLTEDDRFSISDYSRELTGSLENPLTIRAYFSEELPPRLQPFRRQVFDVLAEYEKFGKGKVRIERRDPLTSAADESEAEQYGVRAVPLLVYEGTKTSQIPVYGSLVLVYGDKQSEVIGVAERYPAGYKGLSGLEYEITSSIWQLTNDKPKVGLTGHLEAKAGGAPWQGGGRPRPEFENIKRLLGDACDVETVDLKQTELDPKKMPLLMIVRQKEISDVELFRLDQYMMKGGRVLLFMTQGTLEQSPFGGGGLAYKAFKSGLDAWLEHHGVRVPNEFVLHGGNAPDILLRRIGPDGRPRNVVGKRWFIPIIGAKDALDQENPAVSTLGSVTFFWAHPVDIVESKLAGKTATALVKSHASESWRWTDHNRIERARLDAERDGPRSSDLRSSNIVVAVEGSFSSFFAARPVPPSLAGAEDDEKKDGDESDESDEKDEPKKGPEVIKSSADTQLVVVGNALFISDLVIRQVDDEARRRTLLAVNLVDWLSRSKQLIALRAKSYTKRDLVDEEHDSRMEELKEEALAGKLTEAEYNTARKLANEGQDRRWKSWRWFNILVPCSLIVLAGLIVLVIRTSLRQAKTLVPAAVAPPETEISQ
ncbi:MAG: GldG family protein, partial [Planctomycetota bacterium]|nr:GldG family protein [Planctomycetota bacterium]